MDRNIWFTFAQGTNGEAGIRPVGDKLARFNLVVPWFKIGRMYFPEEMKQSVIIGEFLQEIRLATRNGLKGKDDALDTISMLGYLNPWKPSESLPSGSGEHEDSMWDEDKPEAERSSLDSYLA